MGATTVLVIGKSTTGKTTSLRNLPNRETLMILPNSKDLPWEGWKSKYVENKNLVRVQSLEQVPPLLDKANASSKIKYVVVDDTTHLQNNRMFSKKFIMQNAGNAAFAKWNTFGADVYQLMVGRALTYRDDLTIIYVAHSQAKEDGSVGLLTSGKLLDNTIDIASYFTFTFHSLVIPPDASKGEVRPRYVFLTNTDGTHLAKTPMGYFPELYMDNDLKVILDTIHDKRFLKPTKNMQETLDKIDQIGK